LCRQPGPQLHLPPQPHITHVYEWAITANMMLSPGLWCFASLHGGVVRARVPPMGWRSWNQYLCDVTQADVEAQIDALVKPREDGVSLLSLGYNHVGLDDCWQLCSSAHNFHDPVTGRPAVNTSAFPDLAAMVEHGRARNVTVGFYLNNCHCAEEQANNTHYEQDVALTVAAGFGGLKVDSCGNQRDMLEWADLLEAHASQDLLIESCGNGPSGTDPKHDATPLPAWASLIKDSCPFSFYRVSSDVAPQFFSTVYNANRMVPYLGEAPLSRPGCWAYADMMVMGNRAADAPWVQPLSLHEARSHFAMWAVTSSPLILGLDLTDEAVVAEQWPIISNTEALAVSQSFHGHPGRLIKNSSRYVVKHCAIWASALGGHNCTLPTYQVWAKPMAGGAQAVLAVNIGDEPQAVSLNLTHLGFQGEVMVRDLWARRDNGTTSGELHTGLLASHACSFVLLSPL